jgi:hypothetical protein
MLDPLPQETGNDWKIFQALPTQTDTLALIYKIMKDVVIVFRETFFIHPIICLAIHPWMASYKEENPDRNK